MPFDRAPRSAGSVVGNDNQDRRIMEHGGIGVYLRDIRIAPDVRPALTPYSFAIANGPDPITTAAVSAALGPGMAETRIHG